MYTMKEACEQVGIPYETLRFYCNEGLVPNVKRDKNNYRKFDARDIRWLLGLQCLKRCGMGIQDMRKFMMLCMGGSATIPERKRMLAIQREFLLSKMAELQAGIEFIDGKQLYYDRVLAGEVQYSSSLMRMEE